MLELVVTGGKRYWGWIGLLWLTLLLKMAVGIKKEVAGYKTGTL